MQVAVKLFGSILFRDSLIKYFSSEMDNTATKLSLRSRAFSRNTIPNARRKSKSQEPKIKKEATKRLRTKTAGMNKAENRSTFFPNPSPEEAAGIPPKEDILKRSNSSGIAKDGGSVKAEKVARLKQENVCDIEDVWRPANWEMVLENILKMRKLTVAPVDTMGCEECPAEGTPPEVFRYQSLISVMLSSQTKDEVTYAATMRLIEHGLTVDNILSTPDEILGRLIYPAGFWKTKIKYIKNTSQILKDKYKGDIPRTYEELIKLPGVGPKMAHLVMSCAWKETVGIAVDTHVHRISNRLGWVSKPTKTPEQTRKALESWLPKDQWKPINFTLVGFGQSICKPVGPSCEICLNRTLCPYGKSAHTPKKKLHK